jgi:hypothetical protein
MVVDRAQLIPFLKSLFPFNKLNDSQLDIVAEFMQTVQFKAEDVIYQQGNLAGTGYLYIVFEGTVRLSTTRQMKNTTLVKLGRGEFLGYELLDIHKTYLTTATADTQVTLLRLDYVHLNTLLEKIPAIRPALKILCDSFVLRTRVSLSWCGPDEVVYFIARRHPINLLERMVGVTVYSVVTLLVLYFMHKSAPQAVMLPYILLGIDIVIIVFWMGWNYLDWTNDYSVITNQRVVFQEMVIALYDSRQEAPLNAILSVATATSQLGRILSYGNVIIRTYAGAITFPLVRDPQQVRALVELLWSFIKGRQAQTDKQNLENIIRVKIGLAAPPQPGKKPVPPVIQSAHPGAMKQILNWIADFLRLRMEKDGVITYRTHWFVLLRRIFLPTLVLVIWGLGVVGLVFGKLTQIPLTVGLMIALILSPILMGWWLYQYIDWRNDYFLVTQDQVLDVYKKPLGSESRHAALLKNINSIDFHRIGIIGVLLNMGTVDIRVGEDTLAFYNLYNPAEVQRELFKRLAEKDYREKQAAIDAERQRAVEWISAYHRVIEGERKKKTHDS